MERCVWAEHAFGPFFGADELRCVAFVRHVRELWQAGRGEQVTVDALCYDDFQRRTPFFFFPDESVLAWLVGTRMMGV